VLEEIGLGSVGYKLVDVTERVLLSSHETVVRRNLGSLGLSGAGRLLVTNLEVSLILLVVVLLSVFIDSINRHG